MKLLVVLAIKMMGPGRRRLELVKLAHDMDDARGDVAPFQAGLRVAIDRQPQAVSPNQHAV